MSRKVAWVMHIGHWVIRLKRWAIEINRASDMPGFAIAAKRIADYYAGEDIKRWQEETKGHLGGC